jgi:hypothetical protein
VIAEDGVSGQAVPGRAACEVFQASDHDAVHGSTLLIVLQLLSQADRSITLPCWHSDKNAEPKAHLR